MKFGVCERCGEPKKEHRTRFCSHACCAIATRSMTPERFWEKVEKRGEDECWEWLGAVDWDGYGSLTWTEMGEQRAHRVAYRLAKGPIPDGLGVLHSCDNPPCCNPNHLDPGDQRKNMRDAYARGRVHLRGPKPGERHWNAKLDENRVREIRRLKSEGATYTELEGIFDTNRATLHAVVTRKNWKWVA